MEWQTENEYAAAYRGFSPKVANLNSAFRDRPGYVHPLKRARRLFHFPFYLSTQKGFYKVMSKRPWMKFYPSDWLGSSRLQRCSLAAQGVAIKLICHMHQGEPYGHLTVKGNAAVARLLGINHQTAAKLVAELVAQGVAEICPQRGSLFSPRMVRDREKELKRQADGALGGNPTLKQVVNHEDKPTDTRYQKPERKNQDAASRQEEVVGEEEPVEEHPKARLFRKGKTLLVSLGISEKQSGSVIGRWLKQKNDPEGILAALHYAADNGIIEPIGYVTRCLATKDSRNEKLSLSDRAKRLADQAREIEIANGLGGEIIAFGCIQRG
jgi:hypothetical protein